MSEPTPASATDPTDGDIPPDDVPDSAVIASALYQHLRDWEEAETLADAVIARLGEYKRVVARLPDGVVRSLAVRAGVASETPPPTPGWVDTAVDAWHDAEPGLLLDDQIRRILAAVAPAIAEQAHAEERARVVAELRKRLERAAAAVLDYQWGHVPGTMHARHGWDSDCAVCQGDVAAILSIALPVLVARDG